MIFLENIAILVYNAFGVTMVLLIYSLPEERRGKKMRREEFKMERTGLLEVGDVLPITEGKLPGSYYYTLGKAYAMSANYAVSERIKSGEGKVVDVKETPKGYFVTVEFDE